MPNRRSSARGGAVRAHDCAVGVDPAGDGGLRAVEDVVCTVAERPSAPLLLRHLDTEDGQLTELDVELARHDPGLVPLVVDRNDLSLDERAHPGAEVFELVGEGSSAHGRCLALIRGSRLGSVMRGRPETEEVNRSCRDHLPVRLTLALRVRRWASSADVKNVRRFFDGRQGSAEYLGRDRAAWVAPVAAGDDLGGGDYSSE